MSECENDRPTLRDVAVAAVSRELGKPKVMGEGFHWRVIPGRTGDGGRTEGGADSGGDGPPPINVAMNGWLTPESVRLWVFDPHKRGTRGVEYIDIPTIDDLAPALEQLRRLISGKTENST